MPRRTQSNRAWSCVLSFSSAVAASSWVHAVSLDLLSVGPSQPSLLHQAVHCLSDFGGVGGVRSIELFQANPVEGHDAEQVAADALSWRFGAIGRRWDIQIRAPDSSD